MTIEIVDSYNMRGGTFGNIQSADMHAKDDNGQTAFHFASWNGHLEILEILIDSGADVNVEDFDEWCPVHNACAEGHISVLEILLEAEAEMHAETNEKWTPVHFAFEEGNLEILNRLIPSDRTRLQATRYSTNHIRRTMLGMGLIPRLITGFQ